MFKKAQAAMEFLMTYGWAILVVLIVISALAYFGVLNPSNLVSEKCTFALPMSCTDYRVADGAGAADTVTVAIKNIGGEALTVSAISVTSDAVGGGCVKTGLSQVLTPGGAAGTIATNADCALITTGRGKDKYTVTLTYKIGSGLLDHSATGDLVVAKT
jgi:hypothetical protein